ncbi:MAG: hypothetical protein IIU46_05475 [Treponema sp.]|jgi:ABC-type phosphate/phosphonate transport system substrate-binding protein|nr:hypothetical protein [Treponema sp.]
MKKFLALAASLVIGCVSAFAYSSNDITIYKIGEASTDEFWDQFDDGSGYDEIIEDLLSEALDLSDLEFGLIPSEEIDDDDEEAYSFVMNQLEDNFVRYGVYVSILISDYDDYSGKCEGHVFVTSTVTNENMDTIIYAFEGYIE